MKALVTVFLAVASIGAWAAPPGILSPSEPFRIVTIHRSHSPEPQPLKISGSLDVHLPILTLLGQRVFLNADGTNLTLFIDKHGSIWDEKDNIGCVSRTNSALLFPRLLDLSRDEILTGWTSDPESDGQIIPPPGYSAAACMNTSANAYQMFIFSGTPPPSCTGVALQVVPQLNPWLIIAYQSSRPYNLTYHTWRNPY
jgi:hypothetical protein